MQWQRWASGQPPYWAEDQLSEWIKLNPIRHGHINLATEKAVREADPKLVAALADFERRQPITAAQVGRLYVDNGYPELHGDRWTAAALALCWRHTFAPRIVDAGDAVDGYLERRPVLIAGVLDDWRTTLLEAPLLHLRNVGPRETPMQRDALRSLLAHRLNSGQTTIVSFVDPDLFAQEAAHWFRSGNELVAVELTKKRICP